LEPGLVLTECILASKVQQAIGEKNPGSYFLHFLAKPSAGRAQLGVFGHSGAIEAIYFSF
jgi:hypothetical protein